MQLQFSTDLYNQYFYNCGAGCIDAIMNGDVSECTSAMPGYEILQTATGSNASIRVPCNVTAVREKPTTGLYRKYRTRRPTKPVWTSQPVPGHI